MRLFLISFTHFLKTRRYLSGRKLGVNGNSLINVSVFSQDHRGNVNTSPKQRLSLPLEKKSFVCVSRLGTQHSHSCHRASTEHPPHPLHPTSTRKYTDPTSTWTYTDPTSTRMPNPTPGLQVSRVRPTMLRKESLCGFGGRLHFSNSGDTSVFQTRFLFLMVTWRTYCWMPSVNLDGAAPGVLTVTTHLAHRPPHLR